jgi:hypothetical protein
MAFSSSETLRGGIYRSQSRIEAGFEEAADPPLSGGLSALLWFGKERGHSCFVLFGRELRTNFGRPHYQKHSREEVGK